jgi:acetylornithine/succinyldiaminopimelate/putrescine aminotransferase
MAEQSQSSPDLSPPNDQLGSIKRSRADPFALVLPERGRSCRDRQGGAQILQVKGVPRHKAEIIVCANNFHGRTITIVSFSTDEYYRQNFGPFTPGFTIIPFGDSNALENAITPNTVGFLVEPIQGEAGVIVPPDGFLAQARICEKLRSFYFDQIQTG